MSAQVPLYLRDSFYGVGFGKTEGELEDSGFYRFCGGKFDGLYIKRDDVTESSHPHIHDRLVWQHKQSSIQGGTLLVRPTVRFKTDVEEANGQMVANTTTDSAPHVATDTGNDDELEFEFEPADSHMEVDEEPGMSVVDHDADDAQAHAGSTPEWETGGESSTAVEVGGAASSASHSRRQLDGYAGTMEGPAVFGHEDYDMSLAEYSQWVVTPAKVRSYSCAYPRTSRAYVSWRAAKVPKALRVEFNHEVYATSGHETKLTPVMESDKRQPKRFPGQWEDKWWSVSPVEYAAMSFVEKGNQNHVTHIMETDAGQTRTGGSRCFRCKKDKRDQCYQYTEEARKVIRSPGDSCAWCRKYKKNCSGEKRK